jgi:hypothetical protein
MPPEIIALIDKPNLPIAILFVGAMIGIQIERFVAKQRRAGRRRRRSSRWTGWNDHVREVASARSAGTVDAADQLRVVMRADFKPQPLLNKSEARLFKSLDKMVLERRPNWQVMAQVSLGEILKCEDQDAYACINSKRVDLLIVDEECWPLHAIEYQGGAHFKGAHATAARDAVKKEALRRAGIGYVEVVAGDTPAELRRVVERLLR